MDPLLEWAPFGQGAGALKDPDAEDPMEFVGVALPMDTGDAMAEAVIEEFAFLGFDEERLLKVFRDPFYASTHAIWKAKGDDYVRGLIRRVAARWAPMRAQNPKSQ